MGIEERKAKKRPAHEVIFIKTYALVGEHKFLEFEHKSTLVVREKINTLLDVLAEMEIPNSCIASLVGDLRDLAAESGHDESLRTEIIRVAHTVFVA